MSYLVVSSLRDLPATVAEHGALDLVTLINADTDVMRPAEIAPERHLFLGMNDIAAPLDGMILPGDDHLDALLEFGHRWDRQSRWPSIAGPESLAPPPPPTSLRSRSTRSLTRKRWPLNCGAGRPPQRPTRC